MVEENGGGKGGRRTRWERGPAWRRGGRLGGFVLLPLYPHYSYATTLSSLKEWRRVYGNPNGGPPLRTIEHYFDHPLYMRALVQRIGSVLRQFPDSSRVHLIFTAHGLPISLWERGNPYPNQIQHTTLLPPHLL